MVIYCGPFVAYILTLLLWIDSVLGSSKSSGNTKTTKTGDSAPEENINQAGTYSTYGTQCVTNLIPCFQLTTIRSCLPRYYVTLQNA